MTKAPMAEKLPPRELAEQFLALSADGFREFWGMVQFEWNIEDSDIEAMWFHFGATMRGADTVIGAMHSAVYSGRKAAERKADK